MRVRVRVRVCAFACGGGDRDGLGKACEVDGSQERDDDRRDVRLADASGAVWCIPHGHGPCSGNSFSYSVHMHALKLPYSSKEVKFKM